MSLMGISTILLKKLLHNLYDRNESLINFLFYLALLGIKHFAKSIPSNAQSKALLRALKKLS